MRASRDRYHMERENFENIIALYLLILYHERVFSRERASDEQDIRQRERIKQTRLRQLAE